MSHASIASASASHVRAGTVALALLRMTLMGVAAALVAVLVNVALKVIG